MKKYSGMTVNERLYVSGLLNKFDDAIQNKNFKKLEVILKKVELEDASIKEILNNIIQKHYNL